MLELERGDLYVAAVPEAGGGLAAFKAGDIDILRPALPGAVETRDPLGLSCFPMTPFANRIANGRFRVGDREIRLPAGSARHPLHGYGWRQAWTVEHADSSAIEISLRDNAGPWPWAYRSLQRIWLEDSALMVSLQVQNDGNTPMPASLGLHPYFPGLDEAELSAHTEGMWETDPELIPTHWIGAGESAPFEGGGPLQGSDLDNCFTGLAWPVTISWPSRAVEATLQATHCRFMQVYTRGTDGSFCVEAQTAMPNAFNIDDSAAPGGTGAVLLQPGETLECLTRIGVRPTASGLR